MRSGAGAEEGRLRFGVPTWLLCIAQLGCSGEQGTLTNCWGDPDRVIDPWRPAGQLWTQCILLIASKGTSQPWRTTRSTQRAPKAGRHQQDTGHRTHTFLGTGQPTRSPANYQEIIVLPPCWEKE